MAHKLTESCQKAIADAIRSGQTRRIAANLGGVTYETVRQWYNRGKEDDEGEFFEFAQAIDAADADLHQRLVDQVMESAKNHKTTEVRTTKRYEDGQVTGHEVTEIIRESPDWRAALSVLERRFHNEWSKKDSNRGKAPVEESREKFWEHVRKIVQEESEND